MRVPKSGHGWLKVGVRILLGSFVREGWLKVGVNIFAGVVWSLSPMSDSSALKGLL